MSGTGIEWTDATWNPVTGCTKVSAGCANCYAERWAKRTFDDRPFSEIRRHYDRMQQPVHWRKPRKIFIASMGDLFHEQIPFQFIESVTLVIEEEAAHHTYQILTKRPQRMLEFCSWYLHRCSDDSVGFAHRWPAHAWLGVSVEDQATADERIPILLQTPAAVRFVSIEPMLGSVDLGRWLIPSSTRTRFLCGDDVHPCIPYRKVRCSEPCAEYMAMAKEPDAKLDWIIVGGESGPQARPMHPDWVRSVQRQCQAAGVPFFFKSWGEWAPWQPVAGGDLGGDMRRGIVELMHAPGNPEGYFRRGDQLVRRVGKKRAGRLLDGRTWNETPGAKESRK